MIVFVKIILAFIGINLCLNLINLLQMTNIDSLKVYIDNKIVDLQKRYDNISNIEKKYPWMYKCCIWGFIILFGLMLITVIFIIGGCW